MLKVGGIHPVYGYRNVSYGLSVDNVFFATVKTLPWHRIFTGVDNLSFYTYTSVVLDYSAGLIEFHFVGMLECCDSYIIRGYESSCDGFSWFYDHSLIPHADVSKLMQESDVFIFPSLDETLGWVTIEASMIGVPSIVSNVFALPELVEHNKIGFIVDLELNEKEKRWVGVGCVEGYLAQCIESVYECIEESVYLRVKELYQNCERVEHFGRAAREKAHQMYDVENAAADLKGVYLKAVKGHATGYEC